MENEILGVSTHSRRRINGPRSMEWVAKRAVTKRARRGSDIPDRGFCKTVWGLAALMMICLTAPNALAARPGNSAPTCELKSLQEESVLDPVTWPTDQVLLVDFWASWCAPCAHAFNFLNELSKEFKDQGLSIIAVNVDEEREEAVTFLKRHPLDVIVAIDTRGDCATAFDLPGMPSSFLIDRQGVIQFVHHGFRPIVAQEIRVEIERLLAESPNQTQEISEQ